MTPCAMIFHNDTKSEKQINVFQVIDQSFIYFFFSLFKANPPLQQVFPEFRHVTLDTLKTDRSLHGHTKRVMKVVGNAVAALEDIDSMTEYLQELGRRHRYRQIKPTPFHVS
jgi:hypothetical protein